MRESNQNQECKLLYIGFNQDNSGLVGGSESGFFIYTTEPFSRVTTRKFENGGIGIVELLYRSNILALVGGGTCPQFPSNKVMLWDDSKRECVGELSFHTAVKAVHMRKDIIVVALEKKIHIYNFVNLEIRHSLNCFPNPKGICAMNLESRNLVFAYPCEASGKLRIEHLGPISGSDIKKSITVDAHESDLCAIELNRPGTLLCSASERGTIVRVFSTHTGHLLHRLRRGADKAIIYSLCFSSNSRFIACSSDKSTVHIFELYETDESHPHQYEYQHYSQQLESEDRNPVARTIVSHEGRRDSALGFLSPYRIVETMGNVQESMRDSIGKYIPNYLTTDNKRSIVRFPVTQSVTKCAFGSKPNTLFVAGTDGSFTKYAYDTLSGEYERLFYSNVNDLGR